jgi:hypothetical protein
LEAAQQVLSEDYRAVAQFADPQLLFSDELVKEAPRDVASLLTGFIDGIRFLEERCWHCSHSLSLERLGAKNKPTRTPSRSGFLRNSRLLPIGSDPWPTQLLKGGWLRASSAPQLFHSTLKNTCAIKKEQKMNPPKELRIVGIQTVVASPRKCTD